MERPRTLVTGGAGFIGSHLCDHLLEKGHRVVCLDNFLTGQPENVSHLIDHERFDVRKHDVTDFLWVDGRVDHVFHLASPASPRWYRAYPIRTLEVGAEGTQNVLSLAEEKGARMVLASTSEIYGDPQIHPQPEDYWGHVNPIGPRSVYDEAKRYAEAITEAYRRGGRVDTGIVRIFNTFGPRMRMDDGRALPNFLNQALSGRPLTVYGDGSQTRSFCYVDDLVDGLDRMMNCEDPGPVNLGGSDEISILTFAEEIVEVTGSGSEITFEPLPEDDPQVRRPDLTRARRILDWEPRTDRREGLRRTVEHYRQCVEEVAV